MTMHSLMIRARYWVARQGRVFLGSVAALLGSGVFYAAMVVPLQAQVEQTRSNLQARLKTAATAQPAPPSAKQNVSAWVSSLGTEDQLLEPVALLVSKAESAGVELLKGDYKLQNDSSSALQRYQLAFPVRSNYPALRTWLAQVMQALPALALQSISMQRPNPLAEEVDAKVVFTLHVKKQP